MKQFLIIPELENLEESIELAKKYGLGFEYNDFLMPSILEDEKKKQEIVEKYRNSDLPRYTTLHGDFFDVIPFSMDKKIREIAELRIEQSIEIAKSIGAQAVVFHTNYNPFLNTEDYIDVWIDKNTKFWSKVLENHPDMNIYLENMFDTEPDVIEVLAKNLCKYSNFGVCIDYAHAFLSKVEPEIWAKQLGPYVKHIHLNDNDGIRDLHQAWGDGLINRAKFYECYEKYLQGASVLLETSSMDNIIRSLEMLQKEGFLDT